MVQRVGDPHFSVVLPTYRRPEKLTRVVRAVIEQLGPDDELIVVDDGSGDATGVHLGRIRDPRLRAVRQANQGVSLARNRGVLEARNEVLLFIDDDEIPQPGWLSAHREAHRSNDPKAVMGRAALVVRLRRRTATVPPGERGGATLVNDSFSVRRADFDRIGGFDPRFFHGGEDVDLGIRLRRAGVELEVAPKAIVSHEINRSYRDFRRQRLRRGEASARLRMVHGQGFLPDPGSLSGYDAILIRPGIASRPFAELVSVALWLLMQVAGLAGSWRAQAAAAGRIGTILGLNAERRALERWSSDETTSSPVDVIEQESDANHDKQPHHT